jgi:hypothetical protein
MRNLRNLKSRKLSLESLENRELLSVTAGDFATIRSQYADFDSGIASWIDNNPLEDNDYMLFASYEDQHGNRTSTFSNIYSLKKPTQSQTANALDAFWANYGVTEDFI